MSIKKATTQKTGINLGEKIAWILFVTMIVYLFIAK